MPIDDDLTSRSGADAAGAAGWACLSFSRIAFRISNEMAMTSKQTTPQRPATSASSAPRSNAAPPSNRRAPSSPSWPASSILASPDPGASVGATREHGHR